MYERWCQPCRAYRAGDHPHGEPVAPSLFDPDPPADQRLAVDAPRRHVGRDHPDTAHAMQRKVLGRSGTLRREIYDLLATGGFTDDELEELLGRSHQSVSGARATLKRDGWVRDSGRRRTNRWGNEAIVWVVID